MKILCNIQKLKSRSKYVLETDSIEFIDSNIYSLCCKNPEVILTLKDNHTEVEAAKQDYPFIKFVCVNPDSIKPVYIDTVYINSITENPVPLQSIDDRPDFGTCWVNASSLKPIDYTKFLSHMKSFSTLRTVGARSIYNISHDAGKLEQTIALFKKSKTIVVTDEFHMLLAFYLRKPCIVTDYFKIKTPKEKLEFLFENNMVTYYRDIQNIEELRTSEKAFEYALDHCYSVFWQKFYSNFN